MAHSPRPEPWGSSDQVCSSKPPPKAHSSCSLSEDGERIRTIPAQMKATFSRAPAEGPAPSKDFSVQGSRHPTPPPLIPSLAWGSSGVQEPISSADPTPKHTRASGLPHMEHTPGQGDFRASSTRLAHPQARPLWPCRVSTVRSHPPGWLCMLSPPADVTSALTWGMWLAIILQVIQAPAYHLHGHLVLLRPHCQPQLRRQDTACPGPNGPAAVHLHSQAQHCPTKLIGKGRCVAPASCGSWIRPSWS